MKTTRLVPKTLLLTIALSNTSSAAEARPNILYFYCDDLGWGSIGPQRTS